ncbi:armadillo repeat protein [Poronia punctata]|nr:armadillo repeat protein [Poronia punctata]
MELDPQTIIAQLNAGAADRVAALRSLKNDVIGDVRKKALWVQFGLIPHLVRLLPTTSSPQSNISGTKKPDFDQTGIPRFLDIDTERYIQLQALQLLNSLANAGPAFLSPLYVCGVLPAVLRDSCFRNSHPEISNAALHVVENIAIATESASSSSPITPTSLAETIFSERTLKGFYDILNQRPVNHQAETQIGIVAYLVRSFCREEHHRTALVEAGILDALATRVASFVVAKGYVLPNAGICAEVEGLMEYIPDPPATPPERLDEVFGAIAAIITDSTFRAGKLVYSPSILAIFPILGRGRSSPAEVVLPCRFPTRPGADQMEMLLPATWGRGHSYDGGFLSPIVAPSVDSASTNSRPSAKLQTSLISWSPPEDNAARSADTAPADAETPLVPWLVHIVHTNGGTVALMAASVLASLFKAGFAMRSREANLSLLVVPVLVEMLERSQTKSRESLGINTNRKAIAKLNVTEQVPVVLARLITDSEPMQIAAADCNAVRILCKLFKSTYDKSQPSTEHQSWVASIACVDVPGNMGPECRLGDKGLSPQLIHRRRVRESTMRALGTLATFRETFRKAIVEQEVMSYVIDSLKQFASASDGKSRDRSQPSQANVDVNANGNGNSGGISRGGASQALEENPVPVVISACYLLKMLARSPGILRTWLVDHSVEEPLLQLLVHHDVDVQIAVSACICNLLPEFSPMREPLVKNGVMEILCEQTHSLNSELRLNALWALKHVVDSGSVEFKKRCLEKLGAGWLVQLICDDTEDRALETPDAMDEDVDMGSTDEQTGTWPTNSSTGGQSDIPILGRARLHLDGVKESEPNPSRKARQDDLAIQEQGLGFVRNLIGGGHSVDSPQDTTEMIDHLLDVFGQDHLFGILASKLKSKVTHPLARRGGSSSPSEARVLPPQAKMIAAVIYVLIHIAAGVPRHRQLIISQTDLLRQLPRLFSSQEPEVRVALCHLVNNLTWQDDSSDQAGCHQRTTELKNMGFLKKLEHLGSSDAELDVRERAKSALWQMKQSH